jgi:hypothetical protein
MANIRNAFEKMRGIIPEKAKELRIDIDQLREAEAEEKAKYDWSMGARRDFKGEDDISKIKETIEFFKTRMEEATTPEEKGQMRAAMNDALEAWKERNKRVRYAPRWGQEY